MSTASPPRSVAVLDDAVHFAHECLQPARTASLDLPTPCTDWRLGSLLLHMDDSLEALAEAARLGRVDLGDQAPPTGPGDLVDVLERRACALTSAWRARLTSAPIGVGDLRLGRDTLALVGALEIAVHGWDVAQSTGARTPLPELLAVRLLDVARAVVTHDDRRRRFAEPLPTPPRPSASDRLLAHLGRHPRSA